MSASESWRSSRSKRLQARLISIVGYRIISLLGSTLRWRTDGLEQFDQIRDSGRQPIMAFWHGRILPATYYFRRRGIVVITSENFDGEWIAGIIERFGYGTARGSTSRGGRRALLQLTRDMAAGQPAGIWLAKATGNPVLPFHLEASRYWTLRSWDRTQIPKLFATVALAVGEPFDVPRDADERAIEDARRTLEQRLHVLECRARAMLGEITTQSSADR
jgi:lysophospholipid acyltransferase (LPLAT)-like uncharacterized protein